MTRSSWHGPPDYRSPEEINAEIAERRRAEPNGKDVPDDAHETAETKKKKQTIAEKLVEIGEDADFVELFKTPGGEPHADVTVKGRRETHPVRSKGFRGYLRHEFWRRHKGGVNNEAMTQAVETLCAKAVYEGATHSVHLRFAHYEGGICFDLGDDDWGAVLITPGKWKYVAEPPVRFIRKPHMLPMPRPVKVSPDELSGLGGLCKFLNIEEGSDEYTILCGWLFSAYRGKGPYIIMPIGGEAGSAKSDAAQLVRSLVDPCVGGLSGPPKSDDDLFVQAKNQYVLAFDNLSHISAEMADSVCRLATGGGHVKRTLYTDDDQSVFDGARPIIMTSIVSVATRSDLASRSTPIMLSEIPPEKRRPQEDVYAGFDKLRPRIIGAICDIVAYGLTQIDNIRPNYLPRMADAAKWVMACEGLIWEAGSYMGAFEASQADAADNVLDGSLVWRELKSFLFDDDGKWRADWQGPMSDLLERLESHTKDMNLKRRAEWPKSARGLTGSIQRLLAPMRQKGVFIKQLGRKASARGWEIKYVPPTKEEK